MPSPGSHRTNRHLWFSHWWPRHNQAMALGYDRWCRPCASSMTSTRCTSPHTTCAAAGCIIGAIDGHVIVRKITPLSLSLNRQKSCRRARAFDKGVSTDPTDANWVWSLVWSPESAPPPAHQTRPTFKICRLISIKLGGGLLGNLAGASHDSARAR